MSNKDAPKVAALALLEASNVIPFPLRAPRKPRDIDLAMSHLCTTRQAYFKNLRAGMDTRSFQMRGLHALMWSLRERIAKARADELANAGDSGNVVSFGRQL